MRRILTLSNQSINFLFVVWFFCFCLLCFDFVFVVLFPCIHLWIISLLFCFWLIDCLLFYAVSACNGGLFFGFFFLLVWKNKSYSKVQLPIFTISFFFQLGVLLDWGALLISVTMVTVFRITKESSVVTVTKATRASFAEQKEATKKYDGKISFYIFKYTVCSVSQNFLNFIKSINQSSENSINTGTLPFLWMLYHFRIPPEWSCWELRLTLRLSVETGRSLSVTPATPVHSTSGGCVVTVV